LRTWLFRQTRRIEIERRLQPSVARDECALRVLLRVLWLGWRREKRRQGRLELGLRVGLALLGVEEARAVDQARVTGPEQIRTVVAEVEPGTPLGEALMPRTLDQLVQIAGARRPGRPDEADQDGDSKAKTP
jgi:hypothetical protein